MENKKEKKSLQNDLIDIDKDQEEMRRKENVEKNSSSKIVSSKFSKLHGRVHNSLGDGHEPGTIPGAGV